MPLLLIVTIIKYLLVLHNKFKVYKRMFTTGVICYVVFCCAIVLIDYRIEILGTNE